MRTKSSGFPLLVQIMVVFFLIQSSFAYSQMESFTNLPQFLYSDFTLSRIKMKVGKDMGLLLNYNLVTEKMIFFQKDHVYDMLNQGSVDTIYMNGHMFVPVGKVFYEILPGSHVTFFIQHKGKVMYPPKPAAFGGTSELNSSTYITRVDMSSGVFNMKLEGDLTVNYEPVYWVRVNDKMISYDGEKQFLKIFPGNAETIKQYIKKNKLKLEKPEDLIKICGFCNELMK